MTQRYFELRNEINTLKAKNDELEETNQILVDKVADLAFEVGLLKDMCDLGEEERQDAEIKRLQQEVADKNMEVCVFEMKISDQEAEIAALKASILEKDAEIENLKRMNSEGAVMNADGVVPLNSEEMLQTYNRVFSDDLIEPPQPKKRERVYKALGPRVYNEDGTISRKKPGARKYTSKRKPVTNRGVMFALKSIYKKRGKMTRCPGVGHDYKGVRYA